MHLRGTKDYVLFLSRFRRASERAHPITFVQTAALCLLRKRPLLNLYRPRKISPSLVSYLARCGTKGSPRPPRTTRITLWTIKFECVSVSRARAQFPKTRPTRRRCEGMLAPIHKPIWNATDHTYYMTHGAGCGGERRIKIYWTVRRILRWFYIIKRASRFFLFILFFFLLTPETI